jgi:hypothetical protein
MTGVAPDLAAALADSVMENTDESIDRDSVAPDNSAVAVINASPSASVSDTQSSADSMIVASSSSSARSGYTIPAITTTQRQRKLDRSRLHLK